MAGSCYARDGIVHVQSEELTLEYHLKLRAGRMVEFNMKAVRTDRGTTITSANHNMSVASNGDRTEIALNMPNVSKLLGRACALIKVGVYSTKVGTVVLDLSPG